MVRLRFESDMSSAVKATADITKAVDKLGDSFEVSTREAKKLELAAERIHKMNATPQEKYNQKLEQHAKLVKAGKLSVDDAAKSLDNYRTRLERTMGQSGLGAVQQQVAGFASLAGGIGLVGQALRQMETDAQGAADRIASSLGSMGELQQVSATPQDFLRNVARARSLVRTGVVSPDQQGLAADITFGMVSAGYTEPEKDLLSQIGASKFIKPEGLLGLAEGLGKYRNLFGEKDAGSLRDIVNKVIATAGTAQASVPETLKALLETGEGGKNLGLTDEQNAAAFVAVESKSANPEIAATKLRSFFDQIAKRGLSKGDIPSTIAGIQGQIAGGKSVFDVLGEGRAVQAFGNLSSSLGFLATQQGLIQSAPRRDLLGSQGGLLRADPALSAAARRQEAEGELAGLTEDLDATRENLFDTLRARRTTRAKRGGRFSEIKERINQLVLYSISDVLNLEDAQLSGAARDASTSARDREEIKDYMRRSAEGIEKLQPVGPTPPPGRGRAE